MTVKTEDNQLTLTQNLKPRNKEVEKAYNQIIQAASKLLNVFEARKYRTYIIVDHSKSGKETNVNKEFLSFFWSITLSTNRAGYSMIYVGYDEDALAKFGLRLHNRMLRAVFKHTMFEATKLNIEDSIRINPHPSDLQNFFINRLANGENDFIAINVEEKN